MSVQDVDPNKPVEKILDELREGIDACDVRILKLLNERAAFVKQIGKLKNRAKRPILDAKREEALLQKLTQTNRGPFDNASIHAIFKEIMRQSRRLEGQNT